MWVARRHCKHLASLFAHCRAAPLGKARVGEKHDLVKNQVARQQRLFCASILARFADLMNRMRGSLPVRESRAHVALGEPVRRVAADLQFKTYGALPAMHGNMRAGA